MQRACAFLVGVACVACHSSQLAVVTLLLSLSPSSHLPFLGEVACMFSFLHPSNSPPTASSPPLLPLPLLLSSPQEKQKHLETLMRERVSPPEGVPRLFDLIQVPDRKILPAFFFALRHTLVCEDLDQVSGSS